MSLQLEAAFEARVVEASCLDCRPNHTAPDPCSYLCGW